MGLRFFYARRHPAICCSLIRSLEVTVKEFEERTVKLESNIKDSQKRAGELETKVGATFEKEERYHFLVKRQAEIEDKLDLTKNQAPAQAEELSSETNEETLTAQVTAKPKRERTKQAGIRV